MSVFAHGLFIPWLGYYWDDWIYTWNGATLGREGLIYQLSWDRPFYALWHGFIFSFIGSNVLVWHIYFFVLVVAGALLLVWALRGLWPERRFATTTIGLLYAVYPGFIGQPYAQLYHIHFFSLAMGILSVGLTIRALGQTDRRRYALYTLAAVISGAVYLFIYEIYVGFEVLRLLLIIMILKREYGSINRAFIMRLARWWLPYLAIVVVFVIWRVFFFHSIRSETELSFIFSQYGENLIGQLIRIPGELIRDFLETAVFAWFVPAQTRATQSILTALLASVMVGLAAGVSVLVYERRTRLPVNQPEETGWARGTMLLGLVATLLALLPVILSYTSIKLLELSDRYSLTAVVPIAIFITGAVFLCAAPRARPWMVSALVGLSVMTHFNNGNYYRNVWGLEKDLWWQMVWRAPGLEPGTVLITSVPPRSFFPVDEHEIWAPANLIYAPDTTEHFAIFGLRLTERVADQVMMDEDYHFSVESSLQFDVDFDRSLMIAPPNDGACLRVVDAARTYELPLNSPAILDLTAPHSHIDQIITDAPPPTMPTHILGTEPAHEWCYYFQKAELARQMGQWEQVAALGDEARQAGFAPIENSEWLVFVEGYAAVGRCDDARALFSQSEEGLGESRAGDLVNGCL